MCLHSRLVFECLQKFAFCLCEKERDYFKYVPDHQQYQFFGNKEALL